LRQIAIEMLVARLGPGAVDRLRGFLLDSSPTIREFARYYLGKLLGSFDASPFYREGLAAAMPQLMTRYLLGLGETGDAGDVQQVLPFLAHPRPIVRCAALRAAARLAPPGLVEPFLDALADRSGRIRSVAVAALAARRSEIPISDLERLGAAAAPSSRRCVVLLLADYPAADRLAALLPFLRDADDGVRALAEEVCLRCLAEILHPFMKPDDPWIQWLREHRAEWTEDFRGRVDELVRWKVMRR
jgi:HEAT repeat protein